MSTGMRKWMEKGCPDIPTTPAEVSIGREELRQLRDELAQYKNERDALQAKIAEMEKQEPVWFIDERGEPKRYHKSKADYCKYGGLDLLYALPGAKTQGE